MTLPDDLQPGDVLLYDAPTFIDYVIKLDGGADVSHIEVYAGNNQSLASRNGIGVGQFAFRADGLKYVLRPIGLSDLDWQQGMTWFGTVKGDGYDWIGLLGFVGIIEHGEAHHYFCSSFGCALFWACNFNAFSPNIAAAKIAPFDYRKTPAFKQMYVA